MLCYPSGNLCDCPVGNENTCDQLICEDSSNPIAPNIHYCDAYYAEWRKFIESGGVKELENVITLEIEKQKKPTKSPHR